MPNDMVAIKAAKLPAHLRGKVQNENRFSAAVGTGGFPHVSIKGKVFHITRGDETALVTKGDDGEPAASLLAVIVATNPSVSKVYYDTGYEEGSSAKPTCFSNNGTTPSADAENPQAKKCAVCPHGQWGSRITDNGGKGKACADSMRLAIAAPDQLNDPMLLRVPAASLKTLGQFGAQLAKRGVEPQHVVTKIGFDYEVAHPSLTFKAMSFVDAEQLEEIELVLADEADMIGNITGVSGGFSENSKAAEPVDEPAPKAEASKPRKSKRLEQAEEEAEAPKAKKVRTEAEPTASVDDYDNIGEALDNLNFGDD